MLGRSAASRQVMVKMRESAFSASYSATNSSHQAAYFPFRMFRWHAWIDVKFGNILLFYQLEYRGNWTLRPGSSGGFTSSIA